MQVIALINEKGGVGKTTLATHIAAGLAMRGRRVVLIDADSQANSTTQLGVPETMQRGLFNLLIQEAEWADMLVRSPREVWSPRGSLASRGDLIVLPGNIATRAIPMMTDDVALLYQRMQELDGWADVVVVDTSPTPSMLHSTVYVATDYILFPTKCEMLSLDGLNKTRLHLEKVNQNREALDRPTVELLGVQPVMYDVRTNAHDYGLGLLVNEFKRRAMPAIPMRTAWRDASFAGRTLFAYRPEDVATREAYALVDRVERGIA
jgi:chromosome partitioning protein